MRAFTQTLSQSNAAKEAMSEVQVKKRERLLAQHIKSENLNNMKKYLSRLLCGVHLWRWRGGKNKRRWLSGAVRSLKRKKIKNQNNFITELKFIQSIYSTQNVGLTWGIPGDWEGFGTEVGPVIGCGGLFISRSLIRLH